MKKTPKKIDIHHGLEVEESRLDFSKEDSSSHGLQMVYSDIVTLLLCFFILFVYIKENKTEFIETLVKDLKLTEIKGGGAGGSGIGTGKGDGHGSSKGGGSGSGYASIGSNANLNSLYSGIRDTGDADSEFSHAKKKDTIKIYFKDVNFFERGSFNLAYFAKESLDLFVEKILPYQDTVWLTVQGYTDSTPVRKTKHGKYGTNLELSVLRSTSVYKYLISKGLPERMISIQGFGEHRQISSGEDVFEEDEASAQNRRIVLKIQPRIN